MTRSRLLCRLAIATTASALLTGACGTGSQLADEARTATPVADADPTTEPTPAPTATAEPGPTTEPTPAPSPTAEPTPTATPAPDAGLSRSEAARLERFLLQDGDLVDFVVSGVDDYEPTEPGDLPQTSCAPFDRVIAGEAPGRSVDVDGANFESITSAAQALPNVAAAERFLTDAARIARDCEMIDLLGTTIAVGPLQVPPAGDGSAGFVLTSDDLSVAVAFFRAADVIVVIDIDPAVDVAPILAAQAGRIQTALGADPDPPPTPGSSPLDRRQLEAILPAPAEIGDGWELEDVTDADGGDEPGPCAIDPPPPLDGIQGDYRGPDSAELLVIIGGGAQAASAWVATFEALGSCTAEFDGAVWTGRALDVAPPAGADERVVVHVTISEEQQAPPVGSVVFAGARYGELLIAATELSANDDVAATADRLVDLIEATAARIG